MRSYALLLDGGFVKRKLESKPLTKMTVEEAIESLSAFVAGLKTHAHLKDHLLHRGYWYDASPLSRSLTHTLYGALIEYGASDVHRWSSTFLEQLAQLPMFALRLGETSHEGWALNFTKLKSISQRAENGQSTITAVDLKSAIKQKGVDMRIGMDIAALTLKKHVDMIALVTSDSDFVPAMKFARREGAQLALYSLGHKVRSDMIANADLWCADEVKVLRGDVEAAH